MSKSSILIDYIVTSAELNNRDVRTILRYGLVRLRLWTDGCMLIRSNHAYGPPEACGLLGHGSYRNGQSHNQRL